MPLLNILRYPDARLHKVAAPVTVFDEALKKFVADMAETMYQAPGIGLAATQVDVHKQIIVVDVSERRDSLVVLVNPEIVEATGVSDIEEGCLSVPGIYELVERAERVKVRAYDRNGTAFTLEAQGLLAVCIQHELDHLKGKVFVEHLSQLKQQRIRARIAKQLRKSACTALPATNLRRDARVRTARACCIASRGPRDRFGPHPARPTGGKRSAPRVE